jgi:YfiH family protein
MHGQGFLILPHLGFTIDFSFDAFDPPLMVTKKVLMSRSTDGVWTKINPDPGQGGLCLQFPGLSSYGDLSHAVYTRHGGVSQPPFYSLNASYSTGDSMERVKTNLQIIQTAMGARSLRGMKQVHGKDIAVIRQDHAAASGDPPQADAMITDVTGTALMVKQADCQAVILFDPTKKVISNVHCGWRANTYNLLQDVVHRMRDEFGCRPSELRAAIGPSLGPCCAEFVTHDELFPESFRTFMVRKNYFDLWALSCWQLMEAGLRKENVEVAGICTRCRTDLFYSHRAEGVTGRSATVVMLK